MDKRASQLYRDYLKKARRTDGDYGGVEEGRVGPVESKLLSFPTVQGMVFDSFGVASESVHSLVEALATSRVRVSGLRGSCQDRGGGEVNCCIIHQEDTLPGCHPCPDTLLAGQAGGLGEGGDCSNGEEE